MHTISNKTGILIENVQIGHYQHGIFVVVKHVPACAATDIVDYIHSLSSETMRFIFDNKYYIKFKYSLNGTSQHLKQQADIDYLTSSKFYLNR